jgi:serine/threonine protein kinase
MMHLERQHGMPRVVIEAGANNAAVRCVLEDMGCPVATMRYARHFSLANADPAGRVVANARQRAQSLLNHQRSRKSAPEEDSSYLVTFEHVLVLKSKRSRAQSHSPTATPGPDVPDVRVRSPSPVLAPRWSMDPASGTRRGSPCKSALHQFTHCTEAREVFRPNGRVAPTRMKTRKPAEEPDEDDEWVVLQPQRTEFVGVDQVVVLCCAVAVNPVTNRTFETVKAARLGGNCIPESLYQHLVAHGNVLPCSMDEDSLNALACQTVQEVDSLTKEAVWEVMSTALAAAKRTSVQPDSVLGAGVDLGVDAGCPACARCNKTFWHDGQRRIYCCICRTTVCVACCSSPTASLGRTHPRMTCRTCAVAQCRAGVQGSAAGTTGYFSMCSGSSVILDTLNVDGPESVTACKGCGAAFTLFQRASTCPGCYQKMCGRCILPELYRGGPRHCVACRYDCHRRTVPDPNVPACIVCFQRFSFLRRRHCCGHCGRTVCVACTAAKTHVTSHRPFRSVCRQCFVPKIFRLSYNVAQYLMEWLDEPARINVFYVSRRFRKLTVFRVPCIDQLHHFYRLGDEPQLLGTGGFGSVYRATCRQTGEPRAIKVINKDKLRSYRQVRSLEREIQVHQEVNHPNTTPLYETLQTPTELFLVMGIAGDCDLVDHVVQHGRLSEAEAMVVSADILRFLVYLHGEKSAVHRDLKPDNIMLTRNDHGVITSAKVVDFGLVRPLGPRTSPRTPTPVGSPLLACSLEPPYPMAPLFPENRCSSYCSSVGSVSTQSSFPAGPPVHLSNDRLFCTPCGTLRFCAPEVLLPGGYRIPIQYSLAFKRDVYSVGVIAYIMLSGRLPFRSEAIADLQVEMARPFSFTGAHWEGVSQEAIAFVKWLCTYNPSQRPTAEEALAHRWLQLTSPVTPKADPVVSLPPTPIISTPAKPCHQTPVTATLLRGRRMMTVRVERDEAGRVTLHSLACSPLRTSADPDADGHGFERRSGDIPYKRAASCPTFNRRDPQPPLENGYWGFPSFYM